MGSAAEEVFKTIQKTLDPYVRPREEVARIRQILAVHLDSCLKDPAAIGPLALVDPDDTSSPTTTARGLQRKYLDALNANIEARREFSAWCRKQKLPEADTSPGVDHRSVEEHLTAIRLRQRHEKLRAIEKSLNVLRQKAAASPDFLDPDEIFRDSRSLPDVPKELVTALAIDKATAGPNLKDLIDQLEKHVLRTKLLLRREEQLLDKVKLRSTARPESITEAAKLEALSRTRAELINWIEAELSKAAGDDGDADGQQIRTNRAATSSTDMEEQLASIKDKYTQYVEARKTLLQLVSQPPQPAIRPPAGEERPPVPSVPKPIPATHLLLPYLEQLLSTAREQKGLIAHKSHLSHAIAMQLKDSCQVLDHLAEESQLIPSHPMPVAPRLNSGFGDSTTPIKVTGTSDRVKRWVVAAESAKISTLEVVAEKIEEGQIALEGSMRTLGELDQLLGRHSNNQQDDKEATGEEDLWLADGGPSGKPTAAKKHTSREADKTAQDGSVWDLLDGNLGLLRSDRDGP